MNKSEQELSPAEVLEMVKNAENLAEDQLRDQNLADLLFHKHLDGAFSDDELQKIEREFLEAKRGLNMGQRMELALSPRFLGVINVVELGLSENPSQSGEVDGLKKQYHQLLNWMERNGWSINELPRNSTNRRVIVSPSRASTGYRIVSRTRELLDTSTFVDQPIDGEVTYKRQVDISIAKRMVFAIPTAMHEAIKKFCDGEDPDDPEANEKVNLKIEEFMDNKYKKIHPIRTAYYLMAQPND